MSAAETVPPAHLPWPKMSRATARPLRFNGHPDAELDPWIDGKIAIVYAPTFGSVVDYQARGLWLPEDSWLVAEGKATELGWAVKADRAYYRCSVQQASRRGHTVVLGRGRTADRRWLVPLHLLEKVTVVNRKGDLKVEKVKL